MKIRGLFVFMFVLIFTLALIQAPGTDGVEPREVNSVVENIKLVGEGNVIEWEVEGYSVEGFKVVWSKNRGPEYPTRVGDKYHYYSDPEKDRDELEAFEGEGVYYVRVCGYLGGKCGVYSNEIKLELGVDEEEEKEIEEKEEECWIKEVCYEKDVKSCEGSSIWSNLEESCVSLDSDIVISEILEIKGGRITMIFDDIIVDYEINNSLTEGFSSGEMVEFRFIGEDFLGGGQITEMILRDNEKVCEEKKFCGDEKEAYEYKEKKEYEYEGEDGEKYEYEYEGKKKGFVPTLYDGEQQCDGCLIDGDCVPVCYRKAGVYCALGGELINQSTEGTTCDNSCECESNLCVDGQCISGNTIQKILAWFQRLFGGKE